MPIVQHSLLILMRLPRSMLGCPAFQWVPLFLFVPVHRQNNAQDSEKGRVLQSIASVIQALPPEEGISPVEVDYFLLSHNFAPLLISLLRLLLALLSRS